jgi:hypothetical protein
MECTVHRYSVLQDDPTAKQTYEYATKALSTMKVANGWAPTEELESTLHSASRSQGLSLKV